MKQTLQKSEKKDAVPQEENVGYDGLFWLFMIGCVLGVLVEGIFCLVAHGHWESHVVSVFGYFNILYGVGAVVMYAGAGILKSKNIAFRVTVITLVLTVLELIAGLLLRDGLGMEAWNYNGKFMNFQGIICLSFSAVWGAASLVFCIEYPRIKKFLLRFRGKRWHVACVVLSVFMAVNLWFTGAAIIRWSARHYGVEASNAFERSLDVESPDEWMKKRFVEWKFLD